MERAISQIVLFNRLHVAHQILNKHSCNDSQELYLFTLEKGQQIAINMEYVHTLSSFSANCSSKQNLKTKHIIIKTIYKKCIQQWLLGFTYRCKAR
jgi:hypothetical protein